jgi:hypothetical protein
MLVKHTISGVVEDIPPEKSIGHPWFGQFYVPVTKPKNEVLAKPYKVGENGEREPVESDPVPDLKTEKEEKGK